MNDKFDELAKGMAQSVTRRGALKKFGLGLAGVVLASLGLTNEARADKRYSFNCHCRINGFGCLKHYPNDSAACYSYCAWLCFNP